MGKMKETKKAEISKPQNSKVQRATAEQEAKHATSVPARQPSGGDVAPHDPTNPFTTYGETASTRPLGEFLKFTKGDWFAGADNKVVKSGTKMIVNMYQFRTGWQRWENQKPTDIESGLLVDGYKPPRRAELGDMDEELWERDDKTGKPRDPWQFFNSVPMTDGKTLFNFAISSRGGIEALGDLCKIFGKVYRAEPDKLPMVMIGHTGYWHSDKQYGYIKKPQFTLVGWVDRAKFDAVETAYVEAASEEPADEAEVSDDDEALV